MVYNYYLEGMSNGIFLRHHIEGYKTLRGVEKARQAYCEQNRLALTGQCLYSFNGTNKYSANSYKIIERFNCKTYFEYWN